MDDHRRPIFRDRGEADEEIWISSKYPLRHRTILHCAERKSKLLGS